jgi:hypothetical protein
MGRVAGLGLDTPVPVRPGDPEGVTSNGAGPSVSSSQDSVQPLLAEHSPHNREGWKARFEERGHEVLAPALPRTEGEVDDIRRVPSDAGGLS